MKIPYVIDNETHKLADILGGLWELNRLQDSRSG